jgi:hypothetical protein
MIPVTMTHAASEVIAEALFEEEQLDGIKRVQSKADG